MLESSFLSSISSSPWNPFQDFEEVCVPSFDELSCEPNNECFTHKLSGSSTPVDICSSSSDYDSMLLDEIDKILPVSDTFVSQILEDENIGFSDLDWLTYSECPTQTLNDSSNTGRAFKSDPFEWLLEAKLCWSKMTPADQLNTLHALSDIVTYHMNIAEQMLVIKVIDPKAVISPDDKEFALDSTNLTDAKLKKIKDLIRKHRGIPHRLSEVSSLETKKPSSTMSRRDKINYSRTKRKNKKQKVIEPSENQKRRRQNKKELKSGLFVREMKVLINHPEEDEDVNILE